MAHEERKRPWHEVRASDLNDKNERFSTNTYIMIEE